MIDYFKKKEFIRWFVILITVLNLASLGTIVYLTWEQPKKKKRIYDKRHHTFGFLQKKLDLSESQQAEIKAFQDLHFNTTTHLHKKVYELRRNLYEEMAKPVSDSLKIEATISEMGKYRSELERAMALHFKKMKSVLNDKQKVKFKKLMKRLKNRKHYREKRTHKKKEKSQ